MHATKSALRSTPRRLTGCGESIPHRRHIITSFVIAPLIALAVKTVIRRTVCKAVPVTEKALPFVPDSLFLPVAVAALDGGGRVTGA